jgi:hypothetical protein
VLILENSMAKPILVLTQGAGLVLAGGESMLAARPPAKGDDSWLGLKSGNRLVRIKQLRLGGVSPQRYLLENGYTVAAPLDITAASLRNLAAVHDARDLVQDATQSRAQAIRQARGVDQDVFVVPFDASKPIFRARLREGRGHSMALGLAAGITQDTLEALPCDGSPSVYVGLLDNWVCDTLEAAQTCPRVSEYGGPVEHAAYALCSAGLGTLGSPSSLAQEPPDSASNPFPRGYIEVRIDNATQLLVGIDAGDELVVQLLRDGAVVVHREGIEGVWGELTFGSIISSVAAVLLLDQWEREEASNQAPKRKRAA